MRRISTCFSLLALGCGLFVAFGPGLAKGQEPATGDTGPEEIQAEIAQLQRTIADQNRRLEELEKKDETAQLRRTITQQDRRIAELEKSVKTLQAIAVPVPKRIPAPAPDWHSAANWVPIKKGMSEAQVVELLGSPTRVQSVIDVRTLYYQPDAKSTSTLHGSVTLTDDRVTGMTPPEF